MDKEQRDIFAQNLKIALKNRGWKQIDLAKESGISRDNISHYCRGRSLPRPAPLHRIAVALGVSPGWLRGEASSSRIVGGAPEIQHDTDESLLVSVQDGIVNLQIHKKVSLATATEIMQLLAEDQRVS